MRLISFVDATNLRFEGCRREPPLQPIRDELFVDALFHWLSLSGLTDRLSETLAANEHWREGQPMITIAGLGDLEAALAEHGRNRELFSDACEDFDVPTMTKLDEEEVRPLARGRL